MANLIAKLAFGTCLAFAVPYAASAQQAPATAVPEQVEEAASEVGAAASQTVEEAEDTLTALRNELNARLEQSRVELEELLKQTQSTTGLTDEQIYGIAAGIVAGAVVADLLGGGGLMTISLSAGGAALGNWIATATD